MRNIGENSDYFTDRLDELSSDESVVLLSALGKINERSGCQQGKFRVEMARLNLMGQDANELIQFLIDNDVIIINGDDGIITRGQNYLLALPTLSIKAKQQVKAAPIVMSPNFFSLEEI